ncbi:tRNA 2-thiouridine(34) synthase MnmA [bacterium]|nr:tRNA 2-thiouridine(34) synthase MnmA [bacterium]
MKKKVVVGMSGGVDSSVAALLLKERGYEVVGVHLNLACALNAEEPARSMASKLDIPFYSLNLKKEFEKKVINYFTREYSKGRTPNPCVVCNRKIKFKALLKKAKELKADYIATGHYAKVTYDKKRKRYLLKKGRDRKKDQSYVLCILNQKQLKHTLFPLANFTKEEVRKKARELGIHNRPSSQEICFVPDADYRRFLGTQITADRLKEGLIVDREGKVLGKHKGIAFYTIGQRRWLGVALGKPLYVVAIDNSKNVIVVGSEKEILRDELIARDVNWIAIDGLKGSRRVKAKIRYQHREAEATVTPLSKNRVRVKFEKPQRAITPGQAVVFYDKPARRIRPSKAVGAGGDIVLGGGWIV